MEPVYQVSFKYLEWWYRYLKKKVLFANFKNLSQKLRRLGHTFI